MRGTRWIAAALITLAILLPVSLHVAAQEPTPREATTFTPDTTHIEVWSGRSALYFRGACTDDGLTCVGDTSREDGSFFLAAPAQAGHVVVSWSPVNESLRVLRVHVAGVVVEGESPLRVDFAGLEAGEHAIVLEPARRVVGYHEQVADWTASFTVGAPFDTLEARGLSTYEPRLGCILVVCDEKNVLVSDTVVVPWNAQGALVATWDPREGPMRVSIPGTGFVAVGETPLRIDLSGLTAGEWKVEGRPPDVTLPLFETEIAWTITLARA